MKKIILSLMSATLGCAAFAANCVSVQQIGTDYSNHQITLAITRSGCTGDGYSSLHRNTVWMFVDYRETGGSSWTRATISATSSAGTVVNSGSSKGVWIYDVNGTQTVTLTLNGMPEKYDWCAFATDLPPFVVVDNDTYQLQGTPPFVLAAPNGSTQTVAAQSLPAANLQIAAATFTDATGCPADFCPYTGSDLYRDATHLCGHRTSGAKNWEAWIKDSRDNKLYRIVHMPDNKWWLAQNVKLASYGGKTAGIVPNGCTNEDECGRGYRWEEAYGAWGGTSAATGNVQGICPSGWLLPIYNDMALLLNAIGSPALLCERLRSLNSVCGANDFYGWAAVKGVNSTAVHTGWTTVYRNDSRRDDGYLIDFPASNPDPMSEHHRCGTLACDAPFTPEPPYDYAYVRCIRN